MEGESPLVLLSVAKLQAFRFSQRHNRVALRILQVCFCDN
ncbi:hypothetical protein Pint_33330 [Pistacia integerrima]|uniref:Uncharacterized protein n=1 Tax=Pistacia integerrima TaxID=434235 RepID=A0ACC0X6P2_9ROSI|nr:hypothetical protein Pint_33330 [Pistacia integerrima]